MKILRSLNKKNFLSILFILCFGLHSFADDQPVDIWNVDKNKTENDINSTDVNIEENIEVEETTESGIYKMQSQKVSQNVSVEEIQQVNSNPNTGVSLCIARLFNNITWRQVKQVFIELNWGFVERVDIIRVKGKDGKMVKRAFIHFAPMKWNMRSQMARATLTALQKGEVISEENIEFLRPCPVNSIDPRDFKKIIGMKTNKNLESGEELYWEVLEN